MSYSATSWLKTASFAIGGEITVLGADALSLGVQRGGRPKMIGKLVTLAALLASLLVASPAFAFRLHGAALSDSGVYVTLVLRARQIGNGLVGTIRCIRGSASCLFGRGRLSATFAADGSFTGGLLSGNGRTQCAFAGVLADGGLEGRYRCVRDDGAEDIGSFLVTP